MTKKNEKVDCLPSKFVQLKLIQDSINILTWPVDRKGETVDILLKFQAHLDDAIRLPKRVL